MRWHYDLETQPDGTVHCWPADDTVGHELAGTGCVCGPATAHRDGTSTLVVHASLDGRELLEEHLWPPLPG